MVKKAKYSEVLKNELEERRTTSQVKFPMKYHIYDVMGAELVERYLSYYIFIFVIFMVFFPHCLFPFSIPTTSGTLLRYADT